MTVATWTTAPIPAHAIRDGDRVYRQGLIRPAGGVTDVGGGRVSFMHGIYGLVAEPGDTVTVEVPDEPVDGYNLWKPKPSAFPSGCVCVMRRDPTMPSRWEPVTRDERCPGHSGRYEVG